MAVTKPPVETISKPIESSPPPTLPPPSVVKPVSKASSLSNGITLGGLKNIKEAAREKLMADANRKTAIEINTENLEQAWLEVVELIAAKKMVYKSSVLQSKLTFNSHEITISATVVALDYLKSERNRLLDFFKAYYHNEKINVLFVQQAEEQAKSGERILSTKEIYEEMARRNPNLRILKEKFGLDFEY